MRANEEEIKTQVGFLASRFNANQEWLKER
jgi:hypothetical protein